jgi:hypothetical protein
MLRCSPFEFDSLGARDGVAFLGINWAMGQEEKEKTLGKFFD